MADSVSFLYNIFRSEELKMYVEWNPSPSGKKVGDCSVRAVAKALDTDWETAYTMLCLKGFEVGDMPNSNSVINLILKDHGFEREIIPNSCPDCYTVADFADQHPRGTYVLGTGDHVVCVKDGQINESWDTSRELPIYYWKKEGIDNGISLYSPNDPNGVLPKSNATHLD